MGRIENTECYGNCEIALDGLVEQIDGGAGIVLLQRCNFTAARFGPSRLPTIPGRAASFRVAMDTEACGKQCQIRRDTYITEAAKTRYICALFLGLRLLCTV